jgi:hypothetical protein
MSLLDKGTLAFDAINRICCRTLSGTLMPCEAMASESWSVC